jgi:TPR repeat protein
LPKTGADKNPQEAAGWMRRAAEQGHAEAQEWVAAIAYRSGAFNEESAAWLRKAAEQGVVRAQGQYGSMLLRGTGMPADVNAGLDWLTRAADANDAPAQSVLGGYLLREQPRRAEEALAWLRKGAAQDHPLALTDLANCYERGAFVEQDLTQALAWYSKAAQAGSPAAMLRLAERYERGDGVEQDAARAAQLRAAARAPVTAAN